MFYRLVKTSRIFDLHQKYSLALVQESSHEYDCQFSSDANHSHGDEWNQPCRVLQQTA